jgi:hypothetical protein
VPGFKQMTNKPEHWISNLGKNFTLIKYEKLFLYRMSFLVVLYTTDGYVQGVTKRCRLSWLTNSAPKCRVGGGGGSQPMVTAVHMELE